MKNSIVNRRLKITGALVLVVALSAAALLFALNRQKDAPQKMAETVLTKAYGGTQQEYFNQYNAFMKSREDDSVFTDYFHSVYGEQLTEHGYAVFIANRVPTMASTLANEVNSDLKVIAMKLEPADSLAGSKRYTFNIKVQAVKDATKAFDFKGSITMIQDNGLWKVDDVTPTGKVNR